MAVPAMSVAVSMTAVAVSMSAVAMPVSTMAVTMPIAALTEAVITSSNNLGAGRAVSVPMATVSMAVTMSTMPVTMTMTFAEAVITSSNNNRAARGVVGATIDCSTTSVVPGDASSILVPIIYISGRAIASGVNSRSILHGLPGIPLHRVLRRDHSAGSLRDVSPRGLY